MKTTEDKTGDLAPLVEDIIELGTASTETQGVGGDQPDGINQRFLNAGITQD